MTSSTVGLAASPATTLAWSAAVEVVERACRGEYGSSPRSNFLATRNSNLEMSPRNGQLISDAVSYCVW